jgi:hypothetical protein
MRVFIRVHLQKQPFKTLLCVTLRMAGWQVPLLVAGRDDSPIPVADDHQHHESLPHSMYTRYSIDAHRLRTSEMGCSCCMALGSTGQCACPR